MAIGTAQAQADAAPANPLTEVSNQKPTPVPADNSLSTLTLATAIGLLVIGTTLAVTVFPKRRDMKNA